MPSRFEEILAFAFGVEWVVLISACLVRAIT